ncbi:8140_t:CDS:2, partial [Funneliformis caledonium]
IITFIVTLIILEISLGGKLPMPDLTQKSVVVSELTNESIAKSIRHSLWGGFTQSSGVFTIGEVANSNAGFVGSYQGYMYNTLGISYSKLQPLYITPGIVYQGSEHDFMKLPTASDLFNRAL